MPLFVYTNIKKNQAWTKVSEIADVPDEWVKCIIYFCEKEGNRKLILVPKQVKPFKSLVMLMLLIYNSTVCLNIISSALTNDTILAVHTKISCMCVWFSLLKFVRPFWTTLSLPTPSTVHQKASPAFTSVTGRAARANTDIVTTYGVNIHLDRNLQL